MRGGLGRNSGGPIVHPIKREAGWYSSANIRLPLGFKRFGIKPGCRNDNQRLTLSLSDAVIRPAAVVAGVITEACPRFGFHNLRHGLSTFLIGNGHDPVVVQRMLRQSHVDMTMHYVHNSQKARNAQAQFIERFLQNGAAVTDVEEQPDDERVPERVQ
jgi:integrase